MIMQAAFFKLANVIPINDAVKYLYHNKKRIDFWIWKYGYDSSIDRHTHNTVFKADKPPKPVLRFKIILDGCVKRALEEKEKYITAKNK